MIYGLVIGLIGGTVLVVRQRGSNPTAPNDEKA